MMSPDEISDYPGIQVLENLEGARNYNNHLHHLLTREIEKIESRRNPRQSTLTILDFGAGTGRFVGRLNGQGRELLAIEPDSRLSGEVSRREGIRVVNLEQVDDASIDFAYSLNVFEHIEDDLAALQQLVGKLKAGGTLLIFVPAWPHLFSEFDASIGHFRRYTRKGLMQLAKAANLQIHKVNYFDPLGYFAALVFKLFFNKPNLPGAGLTFFDGIIYPISRLIQPIARRWLGKNLVLISTKP